MKAAPAALALSLGGEFRYVHGTVCPICDGNRVLEALGCWRSTQEGPSPAFRLRGENSGGGGSGPVASSRMDWSQPLSGGSEERGGPLAEGAACAEAQWQREDLLLHSEG